MNECLYQKVEMLCSCSAYNLVSFGKRQKIEFFSYLQTLWTPVVPSKDAKIRGAESQGRGTFE
ncbi:hypothetical protein QJS10_CPA01g01976 [Acorus calamus]|uniref:Uncharacterized protein n=1 Tax=Acorus calamus TaxID=4465 RepID=A0AAV9FME7_ACOCL|nr:hypothetical protein QJS10_CPA01g01976 [Acorus calamus]